MGFTLKYFPLQFSYSCKISLTYRHTYIVSIIACRLTTKELYHVQPLNTEAPSLVLSVTAHPLRRITVAIILQHV
jgi:hypothetical protein